MAKMKSENEIMAIMASKSVMAMKIISAKINGNIKNNVNENENNGSWRLTQWRISKSVMKIINNGVAASMAKLKRQ